MRKFAIGCTLFGLALAAGLGLTGALAQPVGPPNEIVCNRINNGSSGATVGVSVAPVANQQISICGFNATAGAAAGTFQLLSGQGATCATGTQTITPVIPLAINGNVTDHTGSAWFSLPPLNNLCVSITGTGPVAYQIYYAQF
jgi:hypothetical protein